MRNLILLLIIALLMTCCMGGSKEVAAKDNSQEILAIAEEYANGNLNDPEKTITESGIITIGNDSRIYVIDPGKIFLGDIDGDSTEDAVITLYPFQNNSEVMSEHLFILAKEGILMLVSAIESDMRIISIDDGIITAEIPEHSRNSPLFNCPSCWEVVKYHFINGELIKEP